MVNTLDMDVKKEITIMKAKGVDKFDKIFELQQKLMESYPYPKAVDINTKEGQKLIRENAGFVVEELYEGINCLKNRPWNRTQMVVDRDHFNEEMADAFHFFIQLLIMAGFDSDSFFELYLKKVRVNEFRLRSEY